MVTNGIVQWQLAAVEMYGLHAFAQVRRQVAVWQYDCICCLGSGITATRLQWDAESLMPLQGGQMTESDVDRFG